MHSTAKLRIPRAACLRAGLLLCIFAACGLLAFGLRAASAAEPVESARTVPVEATLTGPALQAALEDPIDASWQERAFRDALQSLSSARHVAVVLDRRIDPGQSVTLSLTGITLGEAFQRVAAAGHASACQFGPVAYIGPEHTVDVLRTVGAMRKDDLSRLPVARRRAWEREHAWQWEMLATPRALAGELASEAGAQIDGLDRIPHDLWYAARLPPLSVADRLTLVLAEMDLTFQFDPQGTRVTLVPIPDQVQITKRYISTPRLVDAARKLAEAEPGVTVKSEGNQLVVTARIEQHDRLAPPKAAPTKRPGGKKVYTITIEKKPLNKVLDALASQGGFEFELDEQAIAQAGIQTDQLISFSVKDVDLDGLLTAVLKPAGLVFTHKGTKIVVHPKQVDPVR